MHYSQRFGYCRRRGFLAQKLNRRTNVEPCTNVQSKPFSPAFGNTLLQAGVLSMVAVLFIVYSVLVRWLGGSFGFF